MGLRHDVVALLSQLSRPSYGRDRVFAGADLPAPERIRIATRHGRVRCLRYPGGTTRYVHVHGGAFVTRYPEMDDFWARFVVATTGCEVLLPDYDVAPQARYPVAHDQILDVLEHVAGQGPLIAGGFSGGGNLVASAALRARGRFTLLGQLLAVPSLDVHEDVATKCATAPGGMVGPELLRLVRGTYFRDAARRGEPTASPLLAPDLSGVAPALVVTAQRDTLRAEGDRYAARLADAGVPVEHVVATGVDHYFLHGTGEAHARDLMDRMAGWLGRQMEPQAGSDSPDSPGSPDSPDSSRASR